MFCKYCGNKVDDNARFCASCGARTEDMTIPAEPVITPVVNNYRADLNEKAKDESADKILSQAIASIVLACTGLLAFVGWIVAGACKNNVAIHRARFGSLSGKAKVGNGLATGGLIGSICMTVFVVLYIIFYAWLINYLYY